PSETGYGLLLVSGVGPELDAETQWLGRTLGKQVARLMGRQLLAETRFGQERMLLYSIINAVTDPILLTDTEGKLIIANSHAEKLFAAPEEASEGWRRAAALNNMLFSAALSTSAVGISEMARREPLTGDSLGRSHTRSASCCWSIRSKAPTCCSSCSARGPRTSARAPTSSRSCATSPTWRAPRRRSRKATARCASRRRKCATSGIDSISSSTRSPTRSWSPTRKGTSC